MKGDETEIETGRLSDTTRREGMTGKLSATSLTTNTSSDPEEQRMFESESTKYKRKYNLYEMQIRTIPSTYTDFTRRGIINIKSVILRNIERIGAQIRGNREWIERSFRTVFINTTTIMRSRINGSRRTIISC